MAELAKDLDAFLRNTEDLAGQVDRQKEELRVLQAKLASSREWNTRLNEKITALEAAAPWGPDGWDEKFFFDREMTITFKKIWRNGDARSRRLTLRPKLGVPTILLGDHNEALLLRAVEKMNGRTRAKPE
jgi:hypothetical protein